MTGVVSESRQLALDLHGALSNIDSARWSVDAVPATREQLLGIRERLGALAGASWPHGDELRAPVVELSEVLETKLPDDDDRDRWLALWRAALPAYLALSTGLRAQGVHVPSLRPTNYVRNVWHMSSTSLALCVLLLAPDPAWSIPAAACLCVPFWFLEWIRRQRPALNARIVRFFRLIVHPEEATRVNSATWFVTALLVLALTRTPLISVPALAVLGAGDPAAALIGRRFGRIRIRHGRTLEGSLALVLVGGAAAWLALHLAFEALAWPTTLGIAVAAALGGAAAELLSVRIDDNFSVPVSAMIAAAAAAWGLGALA